MCVVNWEQPAHDVIQRSAVQQIFFPFSIFTTFLVLCVATRLPLLNQAPRNSAYFRNPPVLSGQAWYCTRFSGLWTGPSIHGVQEVDIAVHSNTSGEQECVSAKKRLYLVIWFSFSETEKLTNIFKNELWLRFSLQKWKCIYKVFFFIR